jgi:uncharacterized protein
MLNQTQLQRESYLNKLIEFKDTEFVKVITGVRRSGKSSILNLFKNYLLSHNINNDQIISINFEHPDFQNILTDQTLYEYIVKQTDINQKYYFLFDEIQEVNLWQKLINGLRIKYDCDIYITGSNANLLSGELSTYLSGRYVEIKVMPLSFKEFLKFKNYQDLSQVDLYYNEYVKNGAFPSIALLRNEGIVDDVLKGIYSSILLKDVMLRGNIKDGFLLERLVEFIFDNIGNPITSNSIASTLNHNGIKTRNETIDSYLELLENSFIIYKANRFNIRGKEHLKGQAKYYCVDIGLRNVAIGRNRGNFGAILENIVYLELIRRGYEVSVGKLDTLEIDFVCTKPDETHYYQVAYDIPKENKRESDNLLKIPDTYRKTIITANRMATGNIDGVDVVHIIDFLLK